jgi:hypothetical protein
MYLGLGLMVNAGLALQFSDQIESALGFTPTKQEEEELNLILPKVSLVERGNAKRDDTAQPN